MRDAVLKSSRAKLIQAGGAHILGVQIVWTIAASPCCALLGIAALDAATKLA
jgi:hypothetical protein